MTSADDLPRRCDVVVVGGGVSGLMAAALMANAGLDVTVCERSARPGGLMAGFERGPFRFDTSGLWLNQCGPGGVVRRIMDHLGADAPATPQLRRIRRWLVGDLDATLTDRPDELRDRLISEVPRERDGLVRLFEAARGMGRRMTSYGGLMRSPKTMSLTERARHGLLLARWGVPFLRYAGLTAEAGLDKYVGDPALKRLFCSEERFLSVLVPIGWAYYGDYQAPPAGGLMAIPQWLARAVERAGSRVLCDAPVERVLLQRKRAVGVRLADGREARCEHVVAACDVLALYERLLPPGVVPADAIRRQRQAKIYESSCVVSLGLDVDPRELGFDEACVFVARDDIARAEHQSSDPAKALLHVVAGSARDPGMAPPGKGTLMIQAVAHIDHGRRWRTGPGDERGEAYRAFKQAYADVLVDRVARAAAPDLREHVELMDVATPITYLRTTASRDGSMMGAISCKENMQAKVASYDTPVEGLTLSGQWAEYGGGLPVATKAAVNAALIVLQRADRRAFKRLAAVFDGEEIPRDALD